MNEHQLRQKEMQAQSRKFLSALSAGQAGARDRFNNVIAGGQKLLYRTPYDLIFDVLGVSPVLDPNVPPGMMDVMLTVTFPLRVMANQPNPGAVVVGMAEQKPATEREPASAPAADAESVGDDALAVEPPAGAPADPTGKIRLTDAGELSDPRRRPRKSDGLRSR